MRRFRGSDSFGRAEKCTVAFPSVRKVCQNVCFFSFFLSFFRVCLLQANRNVWSRYNASFFLFFLILNRVSERRSLRIMVDNEKRKNIAFQFPLFTLNIYNVRSYVTISILQSKEKIIFREILRISLCVCNWKSIKVFLFVKMITIDSFILIS